MSFHVAYVLREPEPPEHGDHLASAYGWLGWGDWFLARAEEYPEAAHLAQEGWVEEDDHLAELEEELARVPHAGAPEDVAAVSAALLAALKARPEGCVGVMATDGEAGDEDDDEED